MTAAIILAAGESSRLGQPKQNLLFNGQTLLQRAVDTAVHSNCEPIIVVLGANADKIDPIPGVTTLYNKDWAEGMASSIRIGMDEINGNLVIDNVMIMLCDQPFVSVELLNTMIGKQTETGKPIVACTYNNITGVPVLFHRSLFEELVSMQGQDGAKYVLKAHQEDVAIVVFQQGDIDIDTPGDYERLLKLR